VITQHCIYTNLQLGYYIIVPLLCVGCVWQPQINEHDDDDDDDDDDDEMMTMLITFISEARFPHCDELKNVSFNRLRKYCMYWHCLHSMRASAVRTSVRPSVRLSVRRSGPGGQEIDCCMTGEPAVSSSGDAVHSTALSSKCGECQVVSCWRRKLNTDLLIRGDKNGRKKLSKS